MALLPDQAISLANRPNFFTYSPNILEFLKILIWTHSLLGFLSKFTNVSGEITNVGSVSSSFLLSKKQCAFDSFILCSQKKFSQNAVKCSYRCILTQYLQIYILSYPFSKNFEMSFLQHFQNIFASMFQARQNIK